MTSNSPPKPVPIAVNNERISSLAKIFSIDAFSTFKIFPRIGKIACVKRSRPCLAEPPAESPSTINSSDISGSFDVLSASFPGKLAISNPDFLRVASRARFAAIRALPARIPFSTICLAVVGFSIINRAKVSENIRSTAVRASELPNFVFVCPSNCGSGCFTETIAVNPSRTSSPESASSLSFSNLFLRA